MVNLAWRYGSPCVICGQGFARKRDITAEHVIPVREGGSSELDNLAPSHHGCNSAWARGRRRRSPPTRP